MAGGYYQNTFSLPQDLQSNSSHTYRSSTSQIPSTSRTSRTQYNQQQDGRHELTNPNRALPSGRSYGGRERGPEGDLAFYGQATNFPNVMSSRGPLYTEGRRVVHNDLLGGEIPLDWNLLHGGQAFHTLSSSPTASSSSGSTASCPARSAGHNSRRQPPYPSHAHTNIPDNLSYEEATSQLLASDNVPFDAFLETMGIRAPENLNTKIYGLENESQNDTFNPPNSIRTAPSAREAQASAHANNYLYYNQRDLVGTTYERSPTHGHPQFSTQGLDPHIPFDPLEASGGFNPTHAFWGSQDTHTSAVSGNRYNPGLEWEVAPMPRLHKNGQIISHPSVTPLSTSGPSELQVHFYAPRDAKRKPRDSTPEDLDPQHQRNKIPRLVNPPSGGPEVVQTSQEDTVSNKARGRANAKRAPSSKPIKRFVSFVPQGTTEDEHPDPEALMSEDEIAWKKVADALGKSLSEVMPTKFTTEEMMKRHKQNCQWKVDGGHCGFELAEWAVVRDHLFEHIRKVQICQWDGCAAGILPKEQGAAMTHMKNVHMNFHGGQCQLCGTLCKGRYRGRHIQVCPEVRRLVEEGIYVP